MQNQAHDVVIVGAGFGGPYAAETLAKTKIRLTLLKRRNFRLFHLLLYQVATGALSPTNIAAPLRAIVCCNANTRLLLAEVSGIDPASHWLLLTDGELTYDTLIVATGTTHAYFGENAWEQYAPGLKTVEDAAAIRVRVLTRQELRGD